MANITFKTFIQILLYIALLERLNQCFINLNNESTAFEETELENEATMPSITFCPISSGNSSLIQSFEDAVKEIRASKSKYESSLDISKSYEET